jgi:hypothetical protein
MISTDGIEGNMDTEGFYIYVRNFFQICVSNIQRVLQIHTQQQGGINDKASLNTMPS